MNNNKILCVVFDKEEKMPTTHLVGRKRPSLVYVPLYKKKITTSSFVTKRSSKYPFQKVEEVVGYNEVDTNEAYYHFFKNNRSILVNYTPSYEYVVEALRRDELIKDNIKNYVRYI
jgi:hypothetical protein